MIRMKHGHEWIKAITFLAICPPIKFYVTSIFEFYVTLIFLLTQDHVGLEISKRNFYSFYPIWAKPYDK